MRLFVTVGNAIQPFDRLLRMVDVAIAESPVSIEGICQIGSSRMRPRRLHSVAQMGRSEFETCVANADVVICHAGVGAIATSLSHGHLPIVLARRATLGEHANDHQPQLVDHLGSLGRILSAEAGISHSLLERARSRQGAMQTDSTALETVAVAFRPGLPMLWWQAISLRLMAACLPSSIARL